ncbi:MAG: prepilin-type N-terminal cleavage/methylation domain-containing protein [bacterium]
MNIFFTKNKKRISKEAGFTLTEVLVALTLFAFAITGVITAAVKSGININSAKNRLTANYLAQEGVELVRAKRDSYVLSSDTYVHGWQNFAADVTSSCTGPCDVDVNSLANLVPTSGGGFYSCVPQSVCNLSYSSDGFYIHGTGTSTPFNRELIITPFTSPGETVPHELEITSTVTWQEGLSTQSLSMNESLFNWYITN